MTTGDPYTRAIQVTKITLPLVALAILSTLFLFSDEINLEDAIPYAKIDIETIAKEQRLSNARYATVGIDGSVISFEAAEAKPSDAGDEKIDVLDISGQIELSDGVTVNLSSGKAEADLAMQTLGLFDGVEVVSSSGYRVRAEHLVSKLDQGHLKSDLPVQVVAPFGTLDAGNMLLTETDGTYRLVFNNKVRLLYLP